MTAMCNANTCANKNPAGTLATLATLVTGRGKRAQTSTNVLRVKHKQARQIQPKADDALIRQREY